MAAEQSSPTGPDLVRGISADTLADGQMLLGHVGQEAVLLARRGNEIFALGATCTHYGGPLAEGLLVDDTVRCPWHHACFSLKTGEALHAPALNPVDCWTVAERDGNVFVTGKATPAPRPKLSAPGPGRIVIVGAGAAGNAAAEMLRREGYSGPVLLMGADPSVPYDR